MAEPLIVALPSKGRLMEQAAGVLEKAGLAVERIGAARTYRGLLNGVDGVEVAFLSATEIAHMLREGTVHMGVTGEDLLDEHIADRDGAVDILHPMGFGHADVIVAVPQCWLDVATMADLDEVSVAFHARHGRRVRVATKYLNVTRRFFAEKGVRGYRIVESLGATEGAPAAGTAEVIVDITSTGATLKANHLKILDDGVILRSQAVLAANRAALADPRATEIARRVGEVLAAG